MAIMSSGDLPLVLVRSSSPLLLVGFLLGMTRLLENERAAAVITIDGFDLHTRASLCNVSLCDMTMRCVLSVVVVVGGFCSLGDAVMEKLKLRFNWTIFAFGEIFNPFFCVCTLET